MDALLRAVKKSPNAIRDQLGKSMSRHKKLPEGWGENKEAVEGGMIFYLKHLGFTLVEELPDGESYGEGSSSKCVQTIVTMAKTSGKKLKKVALNISPKGIRMTNLITKETEFEVSIYRICFCTADKSHDKVFAFIVRNTINETMECHAYLCAKKKIAQAVTLTVSQAFVLASEVKDDIDSHVHTLQQIQAEADNRLHANPSRQGSKDYMKMENQMIIEKTQEATKSSPVRKLSGFSIPKLKAPFGKTSNNHAWQKLDDDNLDDSFSMLAANRSGQFPCFSTDLRQEDLDDGVKMYMDSQRCLEAFSRQKSLEDLLNL